MPLILIEGHPLLDRAQSVQDAEAVSRLLEEEAAQGPDMTQVCQQGWMLHMGRGYALVLTVNN